jgi:hypothetical protein
MNNWRYYQIITTFYRSFVNLVGQGVTYDEAINRTFEDFWFYPPDKNELVNLICLIQFVDVKFAIDKRISQDLVSIFKLQVEKINLIKLDEYLSIDEVDHLKETISEVEYKIDKMG